MIVKHSETNSDQQVPRWTINNDGYFLTCSTPVWRCARAMSRHLPSWCRAHLQGTPSALPRGFKPRYFSFACEGNGILCHKVISQNSWASFFPTVAVRLCHIFWAKHFISTGSPVIVGCPSSTRKTALMQIDDWLDLWCPSFWWRIQGPLHPHDW